MFIPQCPMELFQRAVGQWSAATFAVQTPESKIAHLMREVQELAANPADPSEMADCLILLCGIAEMAGVDLLAAARAKMAINRARQWGEPDESGVQSHIEPGEYLVQYLPRGIKTRWQTEGSFTAGGKWRDDRPVNDETMAEELIGYRRTWPHRQSRIVKPNGEIIDHPNSILQPAPTPPPTQ